jgi:hypothetical protein
MDNYYEGDTITFKGSKNAPPLRVGKPSRSREAYLYITEKWVYKAYRNIEAAKEVLRQMETAEHEGVTIPAHSEYDDAVLSVEGKDYPVFVVRSKKIEGQVFYAAKKGGVSVFSNAINAINDKKALQLMARVLDAARRIGLSDPQGFVTPDNEVVFFDIHCRGTGGAVEQLLEAVNARIAQL